MKNDSSRFGHIIQLFTVLLTAILISLFFAVLVLVGKIQGTARVVNYAGLVRGKTQRIVKLEISGTPEDDLLGDVASYIEGLRFGSSELDLVRLDDADFQAKMTALSSEFDDLRNELILVRQRGYTETAIIAKSEHFFQTCDEAHQPGRGLFPEAGHGPRLSGKSRPRGHRGAAAFVRLSDLQGPAVRGHEPHSAAQSLPR